jgi:hypothetical protein
MPGTVARPGGSGLCVQPEIATVRGGFVAEGTRRQKSVGYVAVAAVLVCCDPTVATRDTCDHSPCALPTAISIRLSTSTTGDPVPGAVLFGTGPWEGLRHSQEFIYEVLGGPGDYTVTVEVPGFQTAQRSVSVQGQIPPCGCPWTVTEQVTIAMVPAA